MSLKLITSSAPVNGECLAEKIIRLHTEIHDAPRMTLEKAFLAGNLLAGKKSEVEHGQWMQWCSQNIPQVPERSVQRYIQLFENKDWLIENRKTDTVSDLPVGIRGALEAIQDRDKPKADKGVIEEAVSPASETFREEDKPDSIAQDGAKTDPPVLEASEITRDVPSWESSGVAQKEPVIEDDQEVPTITRQEEASQEITRLCRRGPWKREKLLFLRCSNPKDRKMADVVAKRLLFMVADDQETLGMLLERIENYMKHHGHVRPQESTLTDEWIKEMRWGKDW